MVHVAIDVGPLHPLDGRRTGIGNAVAWMLPALERHPDIDVTRYLTSLRARTDARKLPLPATVAHRLWARVDRPPFDRWPFDRWLFDRWLGRPDVVHGTNYVVPPTRCPRVVSVYDCWFLEHPDEAHPDVRRAGAALRRAVADGAHVVTSSEASAVRARRLLETDRVTAIHLGRPPDPPPGGDRPPQVGDAPYVLAVGTTERRKNVPTLVRAFELLATEVPDVRLVLAGADGDDAAAVSAAVDALRPPLGARVIRLGAVDDATKQSLIRSAAVLAYPSLDEGFGFPILEAQLARTPVVASTAGSIPEVGGPAVLVSPPRDAHALAANLHWVISDAGMAGRLVERGRHNVERFSWEATAGALAALYVELAGSGGAP